MDVHDSPYILDFRYAKGQRCLIATKRFVLVNLTPADVDQKIVGWLNDEEVTRHLGGPPVRMDEAMLKKRIAALPKRNNYLFGIGVREGNAGIIGCFEFKVVAHHKLAQTGIWIGDRAWWGKGVVAEVRNAVLDFAFRVVGCEKVFGHCHSSNTAAIFNYKAEGWTPDGVMRKHHRVGDERVDLVQFARFRDEWSAHINAWRKTAEGQRSSVRARLEGDG